MGKKSARKKAAAEAAAEPQVQQAPTGRPALTKTERRKIYIAVLLMVFMFVVAYFIIKNVFVASYDRSLGGLWQLERIVMEKTEKEEQTLVVLRLLTKDMEEVPEAAYEISGADEPVLTAEGEQMLPELGAYKVVLTVKDLTLFPEVEKGLSQGLIEVSAGENNNLFLKRMQAFRISENEMAFCFGFDENPEVSLFENTKDQLRIQFEPSA